MIKPKPPTDFAGFESFSSAEAWHLLTDEEQSRCGRTLMTIVLCNYMLGYDPGGADPKYRPWRRALEEASVDLCAGYYTVITNRFSVRPTEILPDNIGAICTGCGCSEFDPCDPPCSWAQPTLCTGCDHG